MELAFTKQFLADVQSLPSSTGRKCLGLVNELHATSAAKLSAGMPGWRLHSLQSSPFKSLSVDMNYRILAKQDDARLVLFRVVKHEKADRAHVNRNAGAETTANLVGDVGLLPRDLFDVLRTFPIAEADVAPFRGVETDEQLLHALGHVAPNIAELTLALYEISVMPIPESRFDLLYRDEDFEAAISKPDSREWQFYLHPSQQFVVDLQPGARVAVVGSAGTGKTVCAWHRAQKLIAEGVAVGFICPDETALKVSRQALKSLAGEAAERSRYLVPKSGDEMIQLAGAVDHLIIDEGQQLRAPWLGTLGRKIPSDKGVTLFYDLNQIGAFIVDADRDNYQYRIRDWQAALTEFQGMVKHRLTVNYRNSREIAEYYMDLLARALPFKPLGDIPAFSAAPVLVRHSPIAAAAEACAAVVRTLLTLQAPATIGVAVLVGPAEKMRSRLMELGLPVTNDVDDTSRVIVTDAAGIRGHERSDMVVLASEASRLQDDIGEAIRGYIALSRGVRRLTVIEVV